MSYTIERNDDSVIIRGAVGLGEMVALLRVYKCQGFTDADMQQALELRATFVFVKSISKRKARQRNHE